MGDEVKINYDENSVNVDALPNIVLISENSAESLTRCVLPDILSFFESEEGRKEYDEWDGDWEKLKEFK